MKKLILLTLAFFNCLLFNAFSLQGQTLFSTTFNGGRNRAGTINKFISATNNLEVAKSFQEIAGHPYYTNFVEANNGKLYGMTVSGGSNGNGTIFSYDPATATYTSEKSFVSSEGINPYGSLVQASDGKLYGMTAYGGSSGFYGVIFSFDPSSSTYKKLKDFNEDDGGNPVGSLVKANDGKLYGMTQSGPGSIFSFDPSSSIYTTLMNFGGTNGSDPNGNLIQASDGMLYGMTSGGGSSGGGVIFSFNPSKSTYTKLKDLDSTSGASPYGSLVQATDRKLYGMTSQGGSNNSGVIFSFNPSVSTYTKLKDFDSANGANPYGSLVQASDGKLYSITNMGGGSSGGVLFSFDPFSSAYTKLKDFKPTDGANPYGSLTEAKDGKLYGMTYNGGSENFGVIFSFNPSSSSFAKLKDFGKSSGAYPYGSLVQASNGKLYGMTSVGGNGRPGEGNLLSGAGVIFSFDPSTSIYKKLKDFDYTEGTNPFGSLLEARDGKLYGMTINGGNSDVGVLFSFDPSSSTYTKLKNFNVTNGAYPTGSLLEASDGKLYGVTSQGGSNGAGVIFSYDPYDSTYTNLRDLDDADGDYPYGSLVQAHDGKLYGMTSRGGSSNKGVIFSFNPSSSTYTTLLNFDNTNGASPFGSLIESNGKKLYGMTLGGGRNGKGVIFSFDPSASTYKKLVDFDSINGAHPYGNLMEASNGKLYGITNQGGTSNVGAVFSFDPSSSTYTKLQDFNGSNGANPSFGSGFIEVKTSENKPPTVSITTPDNKATYLAPAAHIKLSAAAADKDGTISRVEFYNGTTLLHTETVAPYGFVWRNVPRGNYTITAKAYDNSGLVTTSAPVHISVVPNKPPTVSIVIPFNNQSYPAPATIHLEAAAKDPDGRITKVEFYNGSTLLQTELKPPYTFAWRNVPVDNYNIIAKATDNWGAVTTSAVIRVSVHPNIAPTVSITTPANGKSFTTPAIIDLAASAQDPDGRITKVEFYNGIVLLRTERKLPYSYHWQNVPAGTYTITAVASDNYGLKTTSAAVKVTVTNAMIVSSRPYAKNDKTASNHALQLRVFPNPARDIVNISTSGLQRDKPATLSVLSASGVVAKTMQLKNSAKTIPLDISSLSKGLYWVKIQSGAKIAAGQFVKL